MSENSVAVAGEFWGCVCVAAGSVTSRKAAIDVTMQQNASEQGKRGLPSELSFNVDPRVAREIALGNANDSSAVVACAWANPQAGTRNQVSGTTATAR